MSTYRFYRVPRTGDGAGPQTAYCPKLLQDLIISNGTQDFWSWTSRSVPVCLCLVWCAHATHITIAADTEIFPLSPELADMTDVQNWLSLPIGQIPASIRSRLEEDGYPMDLVTDQTRPRVLWKWLAAHHLLQQKLFQNRDVAFDFLKRNINEKVSDVPVNIRNRIGAWMTARGLETNWIGANTLVREVIIYVWSNANLDIPRLHPKLIF